MSVPGRPNGPQGDVYARRMRKAAMHEVSQPRRVRRASSKEEKGVRVGYQSTSRAQRSVPQGRRSSLVQVSEPLWSKEGTHAGRWPGAGCGSSRGVRRKDSPAKRTEICLG